MVKNPFAATLPSFYQSSDAYMTFLRPVASRYDSVTPDNTLPKPAGLPSDSECEDTELKTGDKRYILLPLMPIFQMEKDGSSNLIDGRNVDISSAKRLDIVFRLKQTSYYFQSKQTVDIMERIAIEPSIICVFILTVRMGIQMKKETMDYEILNEEGRIQATRYFSKHCHS